MQGYCQGILTEKHYTFTFLAWAEESVSCTFTVLPCFNRDQRVLPLQDSFLLPPIAFQAEQNADAGRRLCQKRPHEDVTEPQSSGMVSEQAAACKRSKSWRLTLEEIEVLQVLSVDPTLSKKLPLSRSSKTIPIVASPPAVAQHLPLSPLTSTWSLKQGQSVFSLSPPKKHASPSPTIASYLKGSSNSNSNTSFADSMSSQSSGSPSPPPSGDAEQDTDQDDREKTFKCGVGTCSKSFAHRQSLRRHVRDNHNPSGQPLYACGICDCTAVYTHPCKRQRHWQSKHPENCP